MSKPNGKGSLDHRIADVLNRENAGLPELKTLLKEAEKTRTEAKAIVDAEMKAVFDPANADPDASQRRLQRAKLTVERLNQAIPQLASRVKRLEAIEYRAVWNEQMDLLEKQRDALAEELAEVYPSVLDALASIYADIDRNWLEIQKWHSVAGVGEHRRLVDAELHARSLSSYTAASPRLRDNLRLPHWTESRTIQFPRQHVDEWNERAALLNQGMAEQMRMKFAQAGSADWAAAQASEDKKIAEEYAARDKELEQRRAEEKAKYQAALRAGK